MSAQQQHNHFGSYANAAALPDDTAEPNLKAGDLAFAIAEAQTYTCTDPSTPVWASGGGGGGGPSAWLGGDYTYTQAVTPVEEVVGDGSFDGSLVTATAYFKAAVTNVFSTTGTTRVRLYDMGTPSTPGTPRLVSTLVFSTNGGPRLRGCMRRRWSRTRRRLVTWLILARLFWR